MLYNVKLYNGVSPFAAAVSLTDALYPMHYEHKHCNM